jgi:hypothetical protein
MLIKFTYVDSQTRRPMNEEPAAAGPMLPDASGISVDFGNESEWPCLFPIFFGHCDDNADPLTPGIIDVITQEIFDSAHIQEMAARVERKKVEIRNQRSWNLVQCDWTQLSDAPLTDEQKGEWRTYRQALRDMTLQEHFPENIEWPAAPKSA